jgi:hypothetical protein
LVLTPKGPSALIACGRNREDGHSGFVSEITN